MNEEHRFDTLAVLTSGGVDSAVMCLDMLRFAKQVRPIYVRFGLRWEEIELAHLKRFLEASACSGLLDLIVFDEPSRELYDNHWGLSGSNVPGVDTADDAVEIPGRNVLLIVKPAIWCRLNAIEAIALGTLAANPFADATAEFDRAMESVLSRALGDSPQIIRPYKHLNKTDVLRLGAGRPLELTFSCIDPVGGEHCGGCNKCAERRGSFVDAGIPDKTIYASSA